MSDFNAVVLSKKDNVAVVLEELEIGAVAQYIIDGDTFAVEAKEKIPVYHKISLTAIRNGSDVYKYGQPIGKATCDIEPGKHVHSHNLTSIREYIAG